ncbi:MAG: MBL fold metallo-hydrolase [Planctomycetota bacterium]
MAWRDLPKLRRPQVPTPPPGAVAGLRVLASGSRGNCSLLVVPDEGPGKPGRTILVDAGLSPARTRKLLAESGVRLSDVDDIVVTHLDRDHFHTGWSGARDCRATLRLHRRHVGRAQRFNLLLSRNEPFDDGESIALGPRATVISHLMAHDAEGVATFRWRFESSQGSGDLGFATDLGRIEHGFVEHLKGVDLLAIESNYCPRMQASSGRPAFLKHRIMGGAGHLSNEECAEAVRAIAPRRRVVLLHLSQECNLPERAAEGHTSEPYELTVSSQDEPTDWVWAFAGAEPRRSTSKGAWQATLFDPTPEEARP